MAKNTENLSFLQRIKLFFVLLYREYTFLTAVYMLEPMEGAIFNIVVFLIFFTSCYTAYIFLPPHCYMILQYLGIIEGTEGNSTLTTAAS